MEEGNHSVRLCQCWYLKHKITHVVTKRSDHVNKTGSSERWIVDLPPSNELKDVMLTWRKERFIAPINTHFVFQINVHHLKHTYVRMSRNLIREPRTLSACGDAKCFSANPKGSNVLTRVCRRYSDPIESSEYHCFMLKAYLGVRT